MAYTIDPAQELRHAFSKRLAAKIIGLTGKAQGLSPGYKVRLAAALKKIAGVLEKQAKADASLSARKPSVVIDGVRFTLVPKSSEWVIDVAHCELLFPKHTHPEAWRMSSRGGNVKTEVSPLE